MSKARKYGRILPCIRNSKADLRWMKKAARKKRTREWRGKAREGKT